MKKIVMIMLIGVISVGFIGCTSNIAKEKNFVETKFASLRNANELTGTGIAPMNRGHDLGLQRDEAISSAKRHIAGQIQTKVDAFFKDLSGDNKGYTRNVTNGIKTVISQKVQGAKVKSEWMSESSEDLYVFMAVDKKKIANEVINSVKETLKNEGLDITDEKMKNLHKEILSI